MLAKRISGLELLPPLIWKDFSKPLNIVINRTNQIVCFDRTLNVSGDTNLVNIQAVYFVSENMALL